MTTDIIEVPGVGFFGTGLMAPAERGTELPLLRETYPLWTTEQIMHVARPGRALFDADWIGDQGEVGACNGFAGAGALERARWLRGLPRVPLSGFGLYAAINGGRDRGSMLDDAMRRLLLHGCPPAELVPDGEWRKDRIPEAAWQAAGEYRAQKCYGIDTEEELATAVGCGFPVIVAVQASGAGVDAAGVVQWDGGPGNHAVLIDGLRRRQGRWEYDMANSWTTGWGEGGRGWLQWERHLTGPLRYHYFYTVPSAVGGFWTV